MSNAKSIFGRIKSPTLSLESKNGEKQTARKARSLRAAETKEPFAIVPESHFAQLAACSKSSAAFAVYLVLYRTWCKDTEKRNPVRLNMGWMRALGFKRTTIQRGLNSLERVGLVHSTHKHGASPMVFLTWQD